MDHSCPFKLDFRTQQMLFIGSFLLEDDKEYISNYPSFRSHIFTKNGHITKYECYIKKKILKLSITLSNGYIKKYKKYDNTGSLIDTGTNLSEKIWNERMK